MQKPRGHSKREISVTWGWTQLLQSCFLSSASNRTGQRRLCGCRLLTQVGGARAPLAPPWRCCQLFARPCARAPRPRAPRPGACAPRPQRTCAARARAGPELSLPPHHPPASPTSLSLPHLLPLQSRTSQLYHQLLQRWMLLLKWRLLASKSV